MLNLTESEKRFLVENLEMQLVITDGLQKDYVTAMENIKKKILESMLFKTPYRT